MDRLGMIVGSNPILLVLVPFITIAVPMAFLFSYTGFGLMVGTLQLKGVRSGRSLFDKAARQLATAGLILGWTMLIGSRIWLFVKSDGYVPTSFLGTMVELSWGVFGFAVIASSIHFAVWKPLSGHKYIHAFLAFFSSINGLLSLFALMGSVRLLAAAELPNAAELTLMDLFNFTIFPSPLLTALILILPVGLAMPPLAAIIWLFIRRKKEDYGRDYYNALLTWCAGRGLFGWVLVTLLLCGTVYLDLQSVVAPVIAGAADPMSLVSLEMVEPVLRVLLPLFICLSLRATAKAELPMRMKPWLIVSFLLSLGTAHYLYTQVTGFVF